MELEFPNQVSFDIPKIQKILNSLKKNEILGENLMISFKSSKIWIEIEEFKEYEILEDKDILKSY